MATYFDKHFNRVPVTDEEDNRTYREVSELLDSLEQDDYIRIIENLGSYVWDKDRNAQRRVKRSADRLGIHWTALVLWYCLDD